MATKHTLHDHSVPEQFMRNEKLKMKINLHLSASHLKNASRVLKETQSLSSRDEIGHIYIGCFGDRGDDLEESIDRKRTILRILEKDSGKQVGFLRKVKDILQFSFRCIAVAKEKNVDFVNVHSLSLLPVGAMIKWITGAKLVYDAHELETETLASRGLIKLISQIIERSLIGSVDYTIVVGGGIQLWYMDKYGIDNIRTVMNCAWYQEPYESNLLREELGIPEDKKIVLYQGGLFEGRGIEGLLSSFSQKNDNKNVLVCMGFGELEELIKSYADKHDNIYLQPAAPPENVLQYTSSADIGVAYIKNPCLNDWLCLPNKLFEFIMAGLPVLINQAPEMRKLVETNEIGAVLPALNYDEIEKGLSKIEAMDSAQLKENLRVTAEAHCWENQEKVMLEGYDKYIL
jgi:glycosyltransferase involved in cell wall biosynthesis